MRIMVNTFGTRGDVQPFLALGVGLAARGHQVVLLTHRIFEDFITSRGLEVRIIDIDPRQVQLQQSLADVGGRNWRITRWLVENFQAVLEDLFRATLSAAQGAELMINSGLSFAGWHVAEKLKLPAIAAYLWPVTPTRELPPVSGQPLPDWMPLRGLYNRASAKLFNQAFFQLLRPLVNSCRDQILDLPPLSLQDYWPLDNPRTPTPLLYGFSPAVIPKPADWSEYQQITGYWFLEPQRAYQPPPELEAFLAAGPPPVSIGFGSMVDQDRDLVTRLALEALERCGRRGVLLGGWTELGSGALPENSIQLSSVPHDWLFPRVAAAIHHGGAGTTAAALRAGVPAVVVPNFADQFFWGWLVHRLGAGPAPLPRKKLSAPALGDAISQAVENPGYRANAARLGEAIRAESGVETAVDWVERFLERGSFG
jgi:sterol 3beta-glucosyltransferase